MPSPMLSQSEAAVHHISHSSHFNCHPALAGGGQDGVRCAAGREALAGGGAQRGAERVGLSHTPSGKRCRHCVPAAWLLADELFSSARSLQLQRCNLSLCASMLCGPSTQAKGALELKVAQAAGALNASEELKELR